MLPRMAAIWVIATLYVGSHAPGASTDTLRAESFTPSNGMTAVLVPDHRVPVATHMLWYRVGSAYEKSENRAPPISSNI